MRRTTRTMATLLLTFAWLACGGPEATKEQAQCGGLAGLKCADGQTCVDDPSDTCDPKNGGADCSGHCAKSD